VYKNSLCDVRVSFGVLFALLLFVLSVPSLLAQTSSTAALTGTVTDPTGAVIANATVTATNTGNGQVRTTTTGSDGVYRFNLLPTGTYSVKFEAGGFETSEVSSVELNVTETPVLNRSLTVGSQSQQVTVKAETEAIQTASSALGTVVSSQSVTDIPLSTRNYLNLIAMSAGANAAVNNASQPGKGGINLFVNGSNSGQNNFQMDGSITDNYYSTGNGTDSGFYAAIPVPNPDVIQEFKIQTSSYDAGYGRNPGANVNVVTKGGTNAFHGNAFEFFRNRVLNANDWFIKRNQLGACPRIALFRHFCAASY
jgi:Carboxypeptidase regulatory-like domain